MNDKNDHAEMVKRFYGPAPSGSVWAIGEDGKADWQQSAYHDAAVHGMSATLLKSDGSAERIPLSKIYRDIEPE